MASVCRSVGAAAAVTERVHAIVKRLHFRFANEPRHFRGHVAAELANYLNIQWHPTASTTQ
jgi:hypothetical protein